MDSLLEKLRAAAPQARDQRDRRRRARLKERHQVRIASGQKMPELPAMSGTKNEGGDEEDKAPTGNDTGLLSPESSQPDEAKPDNNSNNNSNKEDAQDSHVSEGEDIADRAASMLQGLRGNSDADGERARRRRESAEDERRNRRLRRRNGGTSGSKDHSADGSGLATVKEPASPAKTEVAVTDEAGSPGKRPDSAGSQGSQPPPPSIVVSSTSDHPDQPPENEPSEPSEVSTENKPAENAE